MIARILLLSLLLSATGVEAGSRQRSHAPRHRQTTETFTASFAAPGCYAAPTTDSGTAITVSKASSETCNGSSCAANSLCVTSLGARIFPNEIVYFANPLTGSSFCYTVTLDMDAATIPVDGASKFLFSTVSNAFGAANTTTNRLIGSVFYFETWDSKAAQKVATLTLYDALLSGRHEFSVCDDAGTLSILIDRCASPVAATLSGVGTGVISAQPANIYVGSWSQGAEHAINGYLSKVKVSPLLAINGGQKWAALGDSITQGVAGGGTVPYPLKMQRLYGSCHVVDNFGVYGAQILGPSDVIESITHKWTTSIRGQGYSKLLLMGGVNDIRAGSSAVDIWAGEKAIIDQALSDGMAVAAFTVLPFKNWGAWTPTQQTQLLALNTFITAYAPSGNYTVIDSYSDFDDGTGAMKAAYDGGDGLHPNDAGNARLAALAKAVLP